MSVRSRDDSITSLRHSSQEVETALANFMNERARACEAQAKAVNLYDAEMIHIMKELEQEKLRAKLSSPMKGVDHNILRSINATGDEPGDHQIDIENDSHAPISQGQKSVNERSVLSTTPAVSATKKPPPTPAEKTSIRKEMISFFDGCRDNEIDRFNELDFLLGGDDHKKAVNAVEELYQEQTKNFGLLMNFLDEYQPEPFVKAWGNDPDYKKLTKKYKIAKSDQSFQARASLATMKHKQSTRKLLL